ncbi:MAG: P1 family peptidase [Candidatus Glassbacteria bacterium]
MGSITDVPGITVGHAQHRRAKTGVTVILCPDGAVGGVDVRGSAPGTRETDLLSPVRLVNIVHGVVLSGGSSMGLEASSGVQEYLEEMGSGLDVKVARIPIVPQAVIFDLAEGDPRVRPGKAMAKKACAAATSGPVAEGLVGAGTGATVGKYFGHSRCMRGGVGTWSERIFGNASIGALAVVNSFGDVIDPSCGHIIAGTLSEDGKRFEDTLRLLKEKGPGPTLSGFFNTTLAVVATDARLDKEGAIKVAQMAHDGLARTIRPVHTMVDGDVIFSLSTGRKKADVSAVGAAAADVVAEAVIRAVKAGNKL